MGSNKDSQDTVDTLIADLRGAGLADFGPDHSTPLAEWLLSRQPRLVTDDHWKLIDEYERAVGEPLGRPPRQADQRRGDAADGRPRLTWSVIENAPKAIDSAGSLAHDYQRAPFPGRFPLGRGHLGVSG